MNGMKKRFVGTGALATLGRWASNPRLVVALGLALASAPDAHATAVRVMPLGDSITYGYPSSNYNGYRGPLFDMLRKDSLVTVSALDFVGSQNAGIMCDDWHEGHPGWVIDQIAGAEHAEAPIARPNLVLIHAGTNDMNLNLDAPNAPTRLGTLIDETFQDNPGVTLVVAKIIRSANTTTEARIETYNAAIPGVVKTRLNAGKHIVMVDMWSALGLADLADDLHPNDTGYRKMATVWKQGIDQAIANGWVAKPAIKGGGCKSGAPLATWLPQGQVASGVGTTGDRLRFADVDGDGKADYLYVHDDSSVELWINGGAGTSGGWIWTPRGTIASGVGAPGSRIRFADVDGDGKADYLYVHDDSSVDLWINGGASASGGWTWYPRGTIASGVGTTGTHIQFADIDGDGKADYLYVHDDGSVEAWINGFASGGWIWYPSGTIATGVGDPGAQIQFAPLYGTRRADYADIHPDSSMAFWANAGSSGLWLAQGQVAGGVGTTGSRIRFADLDGDGRADYFYVHDNSAVEVWLNRP